MRLKTLKDIQYEPYDLNESGKIVTSNELREMIRKWIEFLEKESFKSFTKYPRGFFQAEILREIFNVEK